MPSMTKLQQAQQNFKAALKKFETGCARAGYPVSKTLSKTGYTLVRGTGLRTMSQQAKLYSQGRTKPGTIITNAKPGESAHNYGLAQDYVLYCRGTVVTNGSAPPWAEIAQIALNAGLVCGYFWRTLKDSGHMEHRQWRLYQV